MQGTANENFIYFGDTGRVRAAHRDHTKYARQDMRFLQTFDIKAVVVACCTVSSLWKSIQNEYSIPSVSVVAPSARHASETTTNGRIGVIGLLQQSTAEHEIELKDSSTCGGFFAACPLSAAC